MTASSGFGSIVHRVHEKTITRYTLP